MQAQTHFDISQIVCFYNMKMDAQSYHAQLKFWLARKYQIIFFFAVSCHSVHINLKTEGAFYCGLYSVKGRAATFKVNGNIRDHGYKRPQLLRLTFGLK